MLSHFIALLAQPLIAQLSYGCIIINASSLFSLSLEDDSRQGKD